MAVNQEQVHEAPESTDGRRSRFRAPPGLPLSQSVRQARECARRVTLWAICRAVYYTLPYATVYAQSFRVSKPGGRRLESYCNHSQARRPSSRGNRRAGDGMVTLIVSTRIPAL